MRPRRPKPSSSAGDQLREALAKSREEAETRENEREQEQQDDFNQTLSAWFNTVAAELPGKVAEITTAARRRETPQTEFSYSAQDAGISLRDGTLDDVHSLPGFKKLDATCQDLDISCTVEHGKHGYGRRINAGKEYLTIKVDAQQHYQPVTLEEARRPGGYRKTGHGRFR